jgi:hypothetical protein
VFAAAWKDRTSKLAKRARAGDRWKSAFFPAFGAGADAAARWVGIGSGGKTTTKTSMGEYGLAQGMKENYSAADWKAVRDPKTTDAQHVAIAERLILKSTIGATGSAKTTATTLGLGKLYHALPLLVRELRTQGLLKASVLETLPGVLASYKPSAKVVSYVKGAQAVTGNAVQDLALRFLAPAAVVSYGDAAITLLDAIALKAGS